MTDQQPEATRNASCKLFQCSREPPFFIPTVAMSGGGSKNSCFGRMLYRWRVSRTLWRRRWWVFRRRRGSSRSLPWRPAPARSLKPRTPRTAERPRRPGGTCSSSPRRLSSIVWFPERRAGVQTEGKLKTQTSARLHRSSRLLSPVAWSSASPLRRSAPGSGSSAPRTSCWCLASWGSGRSQPGTTGWEWTRLRRRGIRNDASGVERQDVQTCGLPLTGAPSMISYFAMVSFSW